MRHIEKGAEPPELTELMKTPGVTYEAWTPRAVKDAVRRDGSRDQLGLCCYCCGPLPYDLSFHQIEHLIAQSVDAAKTLDWSNLLVSCASGRPEFKSSKKAELTCNDHNAQSVLPISPLDPKCESHFRYVRATGEIFANDTAGEKSIDVLNLDCLRLRLNRLHAMEEAEAQLHRLPRQDWIIKFTMPVAGLLQPYEPAVRSLVTYNAP